MKNKGLQIKDINNITIEEAVKAYLGGFCTIFADGKVQYFSRERMEQI